MTKQIYVVAPGMPAGRGGIIRQMDYLFGAWAQDSDLKLTWFASRHHVDSAYEGYVKAVLRLLIDSARKRIDLLHINIGTHGSFYRKLLLVSIARAFGIPYLLHLHGGRFKDFYEQGSALQRRLIRTVFQGAQTVILLGEVWKPFMQDTLGLADEKLAICNNAVPPPSIEVRVEKTEPPHLVYLGHILPHKGVGELVEALAKIQDLDWRATIAGCFMIDDYRNKANALGLAERVHFPGWVEGEAIEKLYASTDLLVLPSHVENQPLCLLEAMARGVPCLATTVGTIPDMIVHGKTGWLVPPRDVDALEAAMRYLLAHPEQRLAMAEASKETYANRFTPQRLVQQMEAIYRQVLSMSSS